MVIGGAPVNMPENAASVMNSCISRLCNADTHPLWNDMTEPMVNLTSLLEILQRDMEKNPDSNLDRIITEVFEEVAMSTSVLGEACTVTPKQFWRVSDLFCSALVLAPTASSTFSMAVTVFEKLGKVVVARDPQAALPLFCDFALNKLLETVKTNAMKRPGILRTFCGFTPEDTASRVQLCKRLQSSIPDLKVFVHCLTILAYYENRFDDTLVDLYSYYATIGLSMPNPKLRAASIWVLGLLHPVAAYTIEEIFPRVASVALSDSWWEVSAHSLTLCGLIIERDPESEVGKKALEVVDALFSTRASIVLRRWGLVTLSRGTASGGRFTDTYLDTLLSLSPSMRRQLIASPSGDSGGDGLSDSLISTTGLPFDMQPITGTWYPLPLAKAMLRRIASEEEPRDRLTPSELELLCACITSTTERAGPKETPLDADWLDIFETLKHFVYVALCDPESCQAATGVLLSYVMASPLGGNVLLEGQFYGALKLLFPQDGNVDETCKAAVYAMLVELFTSGPSYDVIALKAVEGFEVQHRVNYVVSGFMKLKQKYA